MLSYVLAGVVSGAICCAYPFSAFHHKSKIKHQWRNLMEEKEISNKLGDTFEIEKINYIGDHNFSLDVSIPVGLTVDNLVEHKQHIEYAFHGDAKIKLNKYDGIIKITMRNVRH